MACGTSSPLEDRFGRRISYVRLSLTDRCDMRCRYCMAEEMVFLPRSEVLSLEEIATLAEHFVARGLRLRRILANCWARVWRS
jgi:cyclic pyranopterin phosphate synthase